MKKEEILSRKGMIRFTKHTINDILDYVKITGFKYSGNDDKFKKDYDGHMINMSSLRYQSFKNNGIKCVECGIEGKYFIKEQNNKGNDKTPHFNLYAIDDNNKEVLMTRDHIIPKSRGGLDKLWNLQTMCEHCNSKKSNKIEFNLITLKSIIRHIIIGKLNIQLLLKKYYGNDYVCKIKHKRTGLFYNKVKRKTLLDTVGKIYLNNQLDINSMHSTLTSSLPIEEQNNIFRASDWEIIKFRLVKI